MSLIERQKMKTKATKVQPAETPESEPPAESHVPKIGGKAQLPVKKAPLFKVPKKDETTVK